MSKGLNEFKLREAVREARGKAPDERGIHVFFEYEGLFGRIAQIIYLLDEAAKRWIGERLTFYVLFSVATDGGYHEARIVLIKYLNVPLFLAVETLKPISAKRYAIAEFIPQWLQRDTCLAFGRFVYDVTTKAAEEMEVKQEAPYRSPSHDQSLTFERLALEHFEDLAPLEGERERDGR